jgi:hypothetical protein
LKEEVSGERHSLDVVIIQIVNISRRVRKRPNLKRRVIVNIFLTTVS